MKKFLIAFIFLSITWSLFALGGMFQQGVVEGKIKEWSDKTVTVLGTSTLMTIPKSALSKKIKLEEGTQVKVLVNRNEIKIQKAP